MRILKPVVRYETLVVRGSDRFMYYQRFERRVRLAGVALVSSLGREILVPLPERDGFQSSRPCLWLVESGELRGRRDAVREQ